MNVPLTPVRFLRYSEEQFPRKTAVVCQDNCDLPMPSLAIE